MHLSGRSPRGGHGVGRSGPPIHFAAQPGAAGSAGHTLTVMLENHSYSQVIGRSPAPFLNEPARSGALFINSRAITHPSQPTCRHVPWTNVINAPPSLSKPFEDLYHLRPLGHAAHATPITNVWEMR